MIESYNPLWRDWFETIATHMASLTAAGFRIEHIGSTSVEGMVAKPIIDIDVIGTRGDSVRVIAMIEECGYEHVGDLGLKGREVYMPSSKVALTLPVHQLYSMHDECSEWKKHYALRELLRTHPQYREELSTLKQAMADLAQGDRKRYMVGKSAMVTELTNIGIRQQGWQL